MESQWVEGTAVSGIKGRWTKLYSTYKAARGCGLERSGQFSDQKRRKGRRRGSGKGEEKVPKTPLKNKKNR